MSGNCDKVSEEGVKIDMSDKESQTKIQVWISPCTETGISRRKRRYRICEVLNHRNEKAAEEKIENSS